MRALVLERNNRVEEAHEEVLGVLNEIKSNDITSQFVLNYFSNIVSRMQNRKLYKDKYLELVEHLLTKNPQDKDLVFTMYEGSL